MCMKNWLPIPRYAFRDVVCYKVLNKFGYENPSYRSPFHHTYYAVGTPMPPVSIEWSFDAEVDGFFTYEEGYHSFVKLKDALVDLSYNQCVAKCIIPKGSWYFKGTWQRGQANYVSNNITFVGEV